MTATGIIAGICVLAGILLLRPITNVIPSLGACLLRWKECLNLEDSVKLSSDRNVMTAFLVLPFCLEAASYRLYDPAFMHTLKPFAFFAATCGIFLLYVLIRTGCAMTARSRKTSPKLFSAANRTAWSFFCIMVPVTLAAAGICSFSGIPADLTKKVILYCAGTVYIVFIFRKFQIFRNSCSFFTAFLYLCASEILPTGILVLSAVFL